MTGEISILIADDHDLIRDSLRKAMAADAQLKIVAEAEDRSAAEESLERFNPEIAILDLHMPERCGEVETKPVGFDLLRFIQQKQLPTKVIFLTQDWKGEMLETALDLGVKGYVLKNHASEEIVRAVQTVASGSPYVSLQLIAVLHRHSQRISAFIKEHPGLQRLTRQQLKVLKLVNESKDSNEIAMLLGINAHSVNNYRADICSELWLTGPHALSKFVHKYKFELTQFFAELEQSGA